MVLSLRANRSADTWPSQPRWPWVEPKQIRRGGLQVRGCGLFSIMNTKERISEVIENPEQLHELAATVQEEGKRLLNTADEFIRRNPYLALGIALAAGCAIAACLRNRD
jgi:hypothetical protein